MKSERTVRILGGLDLGELRKVPDVSYYFRYPLHRQDFHDLRLCGRLHGHYTAKPLYSRLTTKGRVDRSAGYNGDIAALFVPIGATSTDNVELLLAHIAPEHILLPTGRRNWPEIRAAAEDRIRAALAGSWF